jgi:hypothetical protein
MTGDLRMVQDCIREKTFILPRTRRRESCMIGTLVSCLVGIARMWRFILITFAFLFLAFYQLSGGADYQPEEGSLQRPLAAAEPADMPEPKPARQVPAQDSKVVLAKAGANDLRAPKTRVTLSDANKRARLTEGAKAEPAATGVATVAANPDKIARLIAAAKVSHVEAEPKPEPGIHIQTGTGNVALVSQSGTANGELVPDGDIRMVKAELVNLRQGPGTFYEVEDQLKQGTKVEVLDDDGLGWVELRVLESGKTGWMADYLLVSAN